ncbi:MAG: NADH-quinone oxidoreductase subunit A [Anaerolineales bacterium]|nr:NADH-quinone oxidoreductase subunit A [Anaerolineales bacterium]
MLDYLPIAVLIILATGLAALVVILGHLFGPKRPTPTKMMPYESGMTPYGPGTRRQAVRFYLVAVLFILFDIEVIFFLPWAVALQDFIDNSLGLFILIEMLIFVLILLVGYVYAWKKGALEWE